MANQYLFEMHRYISEKLAAVKAMRIEALNRGNELEVAFLDGQLAEFASLKTYLANQYNLSTQIYP